MPGSPFKPAKPNKAPLGPRISPLRSDLSNQAARQANAMDQLKAKREAFSKKYGHWPSDEELSKYMGGK